MCSARRMAPCTKRDLKGGGGVGEGVEGGEDGEMEEEQG